MQAVIWYGAGLVQAGNISVGDLLSFILYMAFIGGSMAGLGDVLGQLQKASGAADRIMEVMHKKEELAINLAPKTTYRPIQGTIEYKNVHFSYPTRKAMGRVMSFLYSFARRLANDFSLAE